jgi:hypothetical protein
MAKKKSYRKKSYRKKSYRKTCKRGGGFWELLGYPYPECSSQKEAYENCQNAQRLKERSTPASSYSSPAPVYSSPLPSPVYTPPMPAPMYSSEPAPVPAYRPALAYPPKQPQESEFGAFGGKKRGGKRYSRKYKRQYKR